jgi:hypothetical protein
MDLTKILAIPGKPGLFTIVSHTKNGFVAESLVDGKRIPVFVSDQSSILEDIRIFTLTDEVSLKDVFLKIFEAEEGKECSAINENAAKQLDYFATVLPDFDRDRVYASHVKKVLSWYNTLVAKDMIKADEPETDDKAGNEEKTPTEKPIVPKKTAPKVAKAKDTHQKQAPPSARKTRQKK